MSSEFVTSQSRGPTDCPACGRYVGPLEICPYCRARHGKLLVVRLAKYLAPMLAIAGLLYLRHLGQSMGNPQVSIAELTRRSNFATVQLRGKVCDVPRFFLASGSSDPTTGTLDFWLDDGSGRIRVKSYEDATRRIFEHGKVPSLGDEVTAIGNVQVRAHRQSFIVGAPQQLEIARSEPVDEVTAPEVAWGERDEFEDLSRIRVTGWVSFSETRRSDNRYSATVALSGGKRKDGRGKRRYFRIVFPWMLLEMEGVVKRDDEAWTSAPAKGTRVAVTGALRYEGRGRYAGWKLYPASIEELELLEEDD